VGHDPAGDVHGFTHDSEPEPCGTTTDVDATDNTSYDITRLAVAHYRRSIPIRVHFRDLLGKGFHGTEAWVRADGRGYLVDVPRGSTKAIARVDLILDPSFPSPTNSATCRSS